MKHRRAAALALRIAGSSFVLIGLSHLIVPTVFHWGESLAGVPTVTTLGIEVDNAAFLYLFNADLLLYELMLGVLSLGLAPAIGRGDRTAAIFSVALGVFFLIRAPLQFVYFGFTWLDIAQSTVSVLLAALYLIPLLDRAGFGLERFAKSHTEGST